MPLDSAFAAVDDVATVQAICGGLDEGTIAALAARLLRPLSRRSPQMTHPPACRLGSPLWASSG
jgi:hypothetical protein